MKLLRRLLSNLVTLLLSFIMALIIWYNALQVEDPIRSQFLQISVEFVGRPDNSVLVSPTLNRQSVQVFFQGASSSMSDISTDDFTATVDLSQVPFGSDIPVPIQVQTRLTDLELLSQSPEQITVHLEQLVTRNIPVQLDVRGSAAIGYTQGEPLIDPEFITVAGTASLVEPLEMASVTVFLSNERETVRRTPQPVFYNKQGRVASITGLELSTELVEVTIPIKESAGFAEKFINADVIGEPAPGYRIVAVEVTPPSVLIQGRPTQLSALSWLQTEPVDITGLTESYLAQVALALPEGITLAEVGQISVAVTIEPFRTTSIYNRTLQVRGLSAQLSAQFNVETIRVVLFGPLPVLNALLEDEVEVTVDLFGLSEGIYSVTPDVIFPEQRGIELRSLQPTQVTVQISRTITPTAPVTTSWQLPVTPGTATTSVPVYFFSWLALGRETAVTHPTPSRKNLL